MSNLLKMSYDDIESKIMKYLYSNPNTSFNQYSLYNKLLDDMEGKNGLFDTRDFKRKFIDILRNLDCKYDDLTITKNNNNITIILNKEIDTKNYEDVNYTSYNDDKEFNYYKFIFDNHIDESLNIKDKNKNSIYHDLVVTSNADLIKQLINKNKFNYDIKNNNNETPLDLCQNNEIYRILLKEQFKKINNRIEKLEIIEKSKKHIYYKIFETLKDFSVIFTLIILISFYFK
jgi:hypothetical protein